MCALRRELGVTESTVQIMCISEMESDTEEDPSTSSVSWSGTGSTFRRDADNELFLCATEKRWHIGV